MSEVRNKGEVIYQVHDLSVNLRRRGQERVILKSLSFDVRKEECLSIVGPSGTGKTTLLRALAGLIPYAGSVRYLGETLDGPASDVVLVFQDYVNALLRWRTVQKNVALGIEGRIPKDQCQERIDEAIETVGLQNYRDSYPWELSGGMQQRVQIARALAMKPKVLLFDEPFGSLDAMTREGLQDELLRVRSVFQATCVFITHDIDEAVYLGDRLMLLSGSPASLSFEVDIRLGETRNQISTKESGEFLSLRHQVHEQMRKAHGASQATN